MNDETSVTGNDVKRWSAKRKAALVLEIWKGKTTVSQACREFDLTPSDIEEWIFEAQDGMENALRARPKDVKDQYEGKVKDLQAKVGELVLENDALKKLKRLLDSGEEK